MQLHEHKPPVVFSEALPEVGTLVIEVTTLLQLLCELLLTLPSTLCRSELLAVCVERVSHSLKKAT